MIINSVKNLKKRLQSYGPWAVVTGASSGIGQEMATCLAEAGFHLVLIARSEGVLRDMAQDLSHRFNTQSQVLALDLSDPHSYDAIVQSTEELDVGLLVYSAGFGDAGLFIEGDLPKQFQMMDVNCRMLMGLSHYFGKRFAQQKRGGIVLMSSLVGFQGVPQAAHYAATKAYVQSLAEGLHYELASYGVDVIASAPGPINSGFAKNANMNLTLAQKPSDVAKETLLALGRGITVRPGLLSKFLEFSLCFLPRRFRVQMMGLIMKGAAQ
ncbi:MAG: SDR family oxidoreductase [Cyanobacteria bacterium]|nr:SDR family oxidoreductase [Cyanobacteriota bacterium]